MLCSGENQEQSNDVDEQNSKTTENRNGSVPAETLTDVL